MVFSIAAATAPETAVLLSKIIKTRLFTALQKRSQDRRQRLCALIADEYHFLASSGRGRDSDVTALASLRSRSVAILAATQSLDHLASVMGVHAYRGLIPNFGNHFFFRSTEAATGPLAAAVMGMRAKEVFRPVETEGNVIDEPERIYFPEHICPPGALASLESGRPMYRFPAVTAARARFGWRDCTRLPLHPHLAFPLPPPARDGSDWHSCTSGRRRLPGHDAVRRGGGQPASQLDRSSENILLPCPHAPYSLPGCEASLG